jgi:rhodanese-related sulfurtransferase
MKRSEIPEISPQELAARLAGEQPLVVLDVREPFEVSRVKLDDVRVYYAPLSRLAYDGPQALPPAVLDAGTEVIVLCHHGLRSLDVTAWLLKQGCQQVASLRGGIDAYALQVAPEIGRYY